MPIVDPAVSVVVFEVAISGQLRKLSHPGEARDIDSVRRAWQTLAQEACVLPAGVKRIYSEWEPSSEDQAFMRATFPGVPVTYSFSRPPHDGWEKAMREAEEIIRSKVDARQPTPTTGRRKAWQFWK